MDEENTKKARRGCFTKQVSDFLDNPTKESNDETDLGLDECEGGGTDEYAIAKGLL